MKKTQGFIALTSVLILSAVFLSIGIGLLSRAITTSRMSVGAISYTHAEMLAEACAEYALIEMERTLNYEGNASILIDNGSCTIFPIVVGLNDERHIMVEADSEGYVYRLSIYVTLGSSAAQITSKENVAHF